jgi:Zn-dependent protease
MRTSWSVRIFTLFDIPVRVHLLLPALLVLTTVLTPDYTRREFLLSVLSFFAVMTVSTLLHELGHAFAFRRNRLRVQGILLWPLGGQTHGDRARRPDAHLQVALGGVGVNLLLALLAGAALYVRDGVFPGRPGLRPCPDLLLTVWNLNLWIVLFNLLPGLPFDGGAVIEGLLWGRFGRTRARLAVLGSGAVIGLGLVLGGMAMEDLLLAAAGGYGLWKVAEMYQELRQTGAEDEAIFGVHEFSEGALSLDAGAPPPEREERRRAKERERAERAEEARVATARADRESARRRLDDLLDRIAAEGITSLTEEERVFLNEESRRLRAIQRGKSPTRP